jgi:hypothetical protein
VLALPVLLSLGQDPASAREERVLALLAEVHRSGSYRYSQVVFESVEPPLGEGPVVLPRISVPCGNSDTGTFDDARVRALATELCRIYGLAVENERREVEGTKSVVLDAFDPVARVGFELRGHGCPETLCSGLPEDPADALDAAEYEWLASRGVRLHVADVAPYRGYGDEFTPTLAYLAGLVRFLNRVTGGEDVNLDGLLFEREAAWPVRFVAAEGVRVRPGWLGDGRELLVDRPATLTFTCRGLPDLGTAPTRDTWGFFETPERALEHGQLRSSHGAPSVLYLDGEALRPAPGEPEPMVRLRLRQELDGVELVRESRSLALFLTSEFELTRPFQLEVQMARGRYTLGEFRIGAAALE